MSIAFAVNKLYERVSSKEEFVAELEKSKTEFEFLDGNSVRVAVALNPPYVNEGDSVDKTALGLPAYQTYIFD
jgi:hypothetical protein